jgi:hypothetical protein
MPDTEKDAPAERTHNYYENPDKPIPKWRVEQMIEQTVSKSILTYHSQIVKPRQDEIDTKLSGLSDDTRLLQDGMNKVLGGMSTMKGVGLVIGAVGTLFAIIHFFAH